MKMKIMIGITLFILLFVAGCAAPSQKKSADIDVHIGFNSLKMEFLKGTPPQKVFEGDTFPVMIKVKNTGAYSVMNDEKAVLSLGVERDYTKKLTLLKEGRIELLSENAAGFKLDGKGPINPIGDEEIISYSLVAGQVDPQSEHHPSTVIATICYPYETKLVSAVCVDTDVNNLRPAKKVCNMQDLAFGNGQGGPVAVTKIEVNMLPILQAPQSGQQSTISKIKPQFLVYVENRGQGTVIKKEAVKDFCTKSDTEHGNLNIVYVEAFLSDKKLKCSPELDQIKLKDQKDIIRCWLEEGIDATQDPYLSPLRFVLKYGYTQSISANYLIQKTAR